MVAAWPDPELNDLKGRYVFIDWGHDFVYQHTKSLPEITNPGLVLSLGAAAEGYILTRGMAGYLPAEHAKPFLDSGELHLVPNAPRFSYPVWVSWRIRGRATPSGKLGDKDCFDPAGLSQINDLLSHLALAGGAGSGFLEHPNDFIATTHGECVQIGHLPITGLICG